MVRVRAAVTAAHGLVLLAAGASRRLGHPKQLIAIDGETLVHRAARCALATAPADAVIVVGHAAAAIAAAVADLPLRHVVADDWSDGMGASLAHGVAALDVQCAGVMIVLCDQPALETAHLDALVAAWRRHPDGAAACAYADVVGVPAILPRAWLSRPGVLAGDRGARALLRSHAADVAIVAAPELARDIDVANDLRSP